jgi:hypothetical protein
MAENSETLATSKIAWPEGKRFAFSVFDDTDFETVENVGSVYALLADCGLRTTKSCWVVRGDPNDGYGAAPTAEDDAYLKWLLELQSRGFEIGWHGATWHSAPRKTTECALEKFAQLFGYYPGAGANHACVEEAIYWGDVRLTGSRAFFYNLLTSYRNSGRYRGHIEGDEYFWGDLCRKRIKYYRNFIYQDINTLVRCPMMPYHDTDRPYVNYWFASSNGARLRDFNRCIAEKNQDRLEAEGGACIMYSHFANGFAEDGKVEPRFERLVRRLAGKNGWFVPVATLLDHVLAVRGGHEITPAERRRLESRWLMEKLFVGTH